MKRFFIVLLAIGLLYFSGYTQTNSKKNEQTIFAFGGDINKKFVQLVADLTKKQNPKICYVPTASADNTDNIRYWDYICKNGSFEPYVLKVWVSSDKANKSFKDFLLSMDAIIVGGGNTLNMMGIWKAQGIDEILIEALDKGIVLAGGSAGSICWFQNGISDSRPVNLSLVNGLSILPYSNCPHYADSARKDLFHQKILNREIKSGYGSDNLSGILFINGKFKKSYCVNDINNSYFVTLKNGAVQTIKLESEILIDKGALQVTDYISDDIDKPIKYFNEMFNQSSPLNAFISLKYIFANGQQSKQKPVSSYYLQDRLSDSIPNVKPKENQRENILNTKINKVLIYNDSVAGVISEVYENFYGLWIFYNENNKWLSAGEDIGGETKYEAEITFREKAKMHMEKVQKLTPNR